MDKKDYKYSLKMSISIHKISALGHIRSPQGTEVRMFELMHKL